MLHRRESVPEGLMLGVSTVGDLHDGRAQLRHAVDDRRANRIPRPATAAPASYRATAQAAGRARRCAHIIWRALALLWADYARSRPSKADTRERSYSVRHEGPLRPMTRLT
jgi:hypothetical protein